MRCIMYCVFRSSVAVSNARNISYSSCPAALAGWSYSGTSFHNFQPKPLQLCARKQQILVMNRLSSGRWTAVQHYCTKSKDILPFGQVEPTPNTGYCRNEIDNTVCKNDQMGQTSQDAPDLFIDTIHFSRDVKEDPEYIKSLLELEVDYLRQEGHHVPSKLSSSQWEELLKIKHKQGRRKFLRFLRLNEYKNEKILEKKIIKREERDELYEMRQNSTSDHITYGLWNNSMFLRIYESTMLKFYNGLLLSESMHSQPLVIDIGFDKQMTRLEKSSLSNQILDAFAYSRTQPYPIFMHLCNVNKATDYMKKLKNLIPTLYDIDFPMEISTEHYLDIFPKEKLIYLTPHCHTEMTHFDHDAIYIIGGIVDLARSTPFTLAKAKKEGIRMQKFPLDRYLHWGHGNKSLALNHCIRILVDLKYTNDWNSALKHVPSRKLRKPDSQEVRNFFKKTRFYKH